MLLSFVQCPTILPLFEASLVSLASLVSPEAGCSCLKSTQHPSEMIPQDNTHFRFRFCFVLFLVFLLTSPTQASSEAKSCVTAALAWNGVELKFSLGKDPEFVRSLADCVKGGVKKIGSDIQGIIKQLPELIDKVLPVAKSEGLVLLSVYLLYKSYVLYDEAMLMEINVRDYHDKLYLLRKEVEPFRDFMETELIPQWEKGNTADLETTTDRLLEKMGRFSRIIEELIKDISQDYKKVGSDQRLSLFLAVSAGVVCSYSLVRPIPYLWIPVCGAFLGTAGYSWRSYISLRETLPKLELLKKDSTKMSEEITSYQTKLDLTRMRAQL